MKLLDHYIAKMVLTAIGLVTLMLTGLQIFILFVNQLGDLGRMDYGITQAAVFVLLQLPYQVYLFFPMASLLGCLVGLGVLANHSELVVMRAAGMSIGQITAAVLKAALLVIVFVTCLGETVIPYLAHYANDYKIAALTAGQSLRTPQGIWLHSNQDFVVIGSVGPANAVQDVYQFRFDNLAALSVARYIQRAEFKNNAWTAYGVKQTTFTPSQTIASTVDSMPWDLSLKLGILQMSKMEPDAMGLVALYHYLREQSRTHQNTHQYALSFVHRIVQPLTTLVMMVLAIPFVFGPLRSSSMGSKLLVGVTVGFGFHIVNNFMGPVSLVFQLPPVVAALAPTTLFALVGLYLMRRVR